MWLLQQKRLLLPSDFAAGAGDIRALQSGFAARWLEPGSIDLRRKDKGRLRRRLIVKMARVFIAFVPAMLVLAQEPAPAILSRGEAPAAPGAPQVSFRPFLGVGWIYDTRLADIGADSQVGDQGSSGVQLSGGLSGAHTWNKTTLGLNYLGSVERYAKAKDRNAYSQSLLLSLTRRLTRNSSLTLRESAGLFSRSYGLPGQVLPIDPSMSFAPTTSFFDKRMAQAGVQADYIVHRSRRLSFSAGVNGGLTRRWSTALYGVTSVGARGDAQYRVTRRSTVGLDYNYTYLSYHGIPSNTAMHGLAGTYAVRLTRFLEFSASGGVLRAETFLSQTVRLDPAIAAVLGTSVITAASHRVDYVPNVNARLTRTFQHSSLILSGGRTVTQGNGLFLTSITTDISGGYAYTGLRRWSLNAQVGYSSERSIGNVIGSYGGLIAGASASRQIARYVHAMASFESRRYDSRSFNWFNRFDYSARIGLAFTPGDIPLSMW